MVLLDTDIFFISNNFGRYPYRSFHEILLRQEQQAIEKSHYSKRIVRFCIILPILSYDICILKFKAKSDKKERYIKVPLFFCYTNLEYMID